MTSQQDFAHIARKLLGYAEHKGMSFMWVRTGL